jgi:cation diffusion facilitator family transporter
VALKPLVRSRADRRPKATAATLRSVGVSLAVNAVETIALAISAWLTGAVSLRAQTAANAADTAVEVFLLIGVLSSSRPPDDSHPLGYGRERFLWSLFAAMGIFVGGSGLALNGAIHAALHPSPLENYSIAYVVLVSTIAMDALALAIALRPLREEASARGVSLRTHLHRTTDPASVTVAVGGGCAVAGGIVATLGLIVSEQMGSATPDTVASAIIGVLLFVASMLLVRTNRELLLGRGAPPSTVRRMRRVIAAQAGVVDVPDLFAVVVGPSSVIVDGDVTFADDLEVPSVEEIINRSTAALREHWPAIEFVYLTPVARARPRGLRP